MSFQDIVNLLTNNGIGIVCIIYFLFRDYKFTNTMLETLTTIKLMIAADQQKEVDDGR